MIESFTRKKTFLLIVATVLLLWTGVSSLSAKNFPDLAIEKISVSNQCKLVVTVKNNGPGFLPVFAFAQSDDRSLGIDIAINDKSWGKVDIWKFDKAKRLRMPGGEVVCQLDYTVTETIEVRAEIDLWNHITESNEENNMLMQEVSCDAKVDITIPTPSETQTPQSPETPKPLQTQPQKPNIPQPAEPTVTSPKPKQTVATPEPEPDAPNPPQRFVLRFDEIQLAYKKSFNTLQVMVGNDIVSSGSDWERCKLAPHLFHIRHEEWQGVSWEVDTKAKAVYQVDTDFFCIPASKKKKISAIIEETGDFIYISFPQAQMVYEPATQSLQLKLGETILSAGQNWEKCNLSNSVYHIREEFWSLSYWKVNTLKKKVWRIKGKPFRKPASTGEPLSIAVSVIE